MSTMGKPGTSTKYTLAPLSKVQCWMGMPALAVLCNHAMLKANKKRFIVHPPHHAAHQAAVCETLVEAPIAAAK